MKVSEHIELSPDASLMESLRGIGYSIEDAVADIIDNSITANAQEIQIKCTLKDKMPIMAIIDNGVGMSKEELIAAMRFGSTSPGEDRTENDLGRFGLGMKTASLSQCRHLTVLSKRDGIISCCEWNLDFISNNGDSKWYLGVLDSENIQNREQLCSLYNDYLSQPESGTIVLWENIDKVSHETKNFNRTVASIKEHIELYFHRFLENENRISISVNNDYLKAFDPFNLENNATRELEEQQINLDGQKIVVQPFVLPHKNKVSAEVYEKYAGSKGYLHNQGFYIYRNHRLIIKGTWFNLIKKEELNKLIRVKVDIPTALDYLWKINVRKSQAFPPDTVKNKLRKIISRIETAGRQVYRQRGRKINSEIFPVWEQIVTHGQLFYKINRSHPIIEEFNNTLSTAKKKMLEHIIGMIEDSIPIDRIAYDIKGGEKVETGSLAEERLAVLLDFYIEKLSANSKNIANEILTCEPFVFQQEKTKKLLQNKGLI